MVDLVLRVGTLTFTSSWLLSPRKITQAVNKDWGKVDIWEGGEIVKWSSWRLVEIQ